MKKVFVVSLPGAESKLLVADDEKDAFDRRGEVDPSYEYLPVQVSELTIEGYEIHAKPKKVQEPEPQALVIPVEKPPEQPKQKKKPSKK